MCRRGSVMQICGPQVWGGARWAHINMTFVCLESDGRHSRMEKQAFIEPGLIGLYFDGRAAGHHHQHGFAVAGYF